MADVKVAMEKQSWLHVSGSMSGQTANQWLSFAAQLLYQIDSTGIIAKINLDEQYRMAYDAHNNTLTKHSFNAPQGLNLASAAQCLKSTREMFLSQDAEIAYTAETLDGRKVQIEQVDMVVDHVYRL